jgi:methionyl-tRNA formyltransferase
VNKLRVAIVTSNPAGNAARIAHYLAESVDSVEIVSALIDTGTESDRRRQRERLRAWYRHGGAGYVLWRLWLHARPKVVREAPRPSYCRSLHELGEEFGFEVVELPNVNSTAAQDALRASQVELGISISNRVIAPDVFSIPRLGMINLHHGRIPDYRGGPPCFWELYNGESTMGVSVHRIDAQLDHGQLLAQAEVPIVPGDDPKTLMERARSLDYRLMGEVIDALARGTQDEIPVDFSGSSVSTLPSRAQVRALGSRVGRPIRHDDYLSAALDEIT